MICIHCGKPAQPAPPVPPWAVAPLFQHVDIEDDMSHLAHVNPAPSR